MDENERRRFESLEVLRLAAYQSFNDRRSYEWKLSLGIWSAQAIVAAALLRSEDDKTLQGTSRWVAAAAFGAVLALLHLFFTWRVGRANRVDQDAFIVCRDAMEALASLEVGDDLKDGREELRKWRGRWSWFTQVGITLLFTVGWVLIIRARSG